MLAITLPAAAEQRSQLEALVERRLDLLGFERVDVTSLTNRQLSALHLHLQGRALNIGGFNRMNARSRVEIILGWDGYELHD